MPTEILDLVREGKLAYTKAQAISRVRDQSFRQVLLEEALSQDLSLGQIKKRIQENSNSAFPEGKLPKDVLNRAYQRIQASKVWENPQKWEKVRALLKELSLLLEG